jgi:hypothetical protein
MGDTISTIVRLAGTTVVHIQGNRLVHAGTTVVKYVVIYYLVLSSEHYSTRQQLAVLCTNQLATYSLALAFETLA